MIRLFFALTIFTFCQPFGWSDAKKHTWKNFASGLSDQETGFRGLLEIHNQKTKGVSPDFVVPYFIQRLSSFLDGHKVVGLWGQLSPEQKEDFIGRYGESIVSAIEQNSFANEQLNKLNEVKKKMRDLVVRLRGNRGFEISDEEIMLSATENLRDRYFFLREKIEERRREINRSKTDYFELTNQLEEEVLRTVAENVEVYSQFVEDIAKPSVEHARSAIEDFFTHEQN